MDRKPVHVVVTPNYHQARESFLRNVLAAKESGALVRAQHYRLRIETADLITEYHSANVVDHSIRGLAIDSFEVDPHARLSPVAEMSLRAAQACRGALVA